MLKHYSHIGMQAKRRAVDALVPKPAAPARNAATDTDAPQAADVAAISESDAKDSPKVAQVH